LQVHRLSLGFTCAYLLESEPGLYLVDAGSPGQESRVLGCMRSLGRDDLRLILITHSHLDHYGSAAALRRLTGARLAIHRADAPAMARGETPLGQPRGRGWLVYALQPLLARLLRPEPTRADLLLEDGADLRAWGLAATLIHTPGHTPGSACWLVEGRLAFAGDLLSTTGRPHVQRYYACDWAAIPVSLARLQRLQPQQIYPGHGRIILTGEEFQRL
jgi:glyoxylase-like metal-dependent hydrolase (beta-lactamase superfamily II)